MLSVLVALLPTRTLIIVAVLPTRTLIIVAVLPSTASARGLFDYDLNDRTRNNGAKLIVKHFDTSVAQHFYPIKITTT